MTAAEAQQEEDTAASVRLLADLRQVFTAADAEALYTSTILEALHQLEDAPWADWYGHPLTTRDLASCCAPTRSSPRTSVNTAPAPPARAMPAPTSRTPGHAMCRYIHHKRYRRPNPQVTPATGM